ncbi:hypothetical protein [Cohnella cellulosilytica]|uniref:Tetracyclin repressor-like C-terminal domain-containing protein n=1 Tax=Cohnella cellulosilytica TaxID=986710 RepID=A0ABW2FJZ0_9BACL
MDFKKKYALASTSLFKILRTVFPAWNDKTIAKFIRMQLQYAIGLYPSTSLSSVQIEANKQSGIPYEQVDFVAEFSEFVFYTLAYLNR